MAGGGVAAGSWIGSSDRFAAYPSENPVTPQDIAATIYQLMGLKPETELRDNQNRPYPLASGSPIPGVIG